MAGKHDILLAKSTDGGNSFGKTINVSHNREFSMYPVVAPSPRSKNDLYMAWEDNGPGNYEIYFAKSTDSGNSFSAPVNLTSRNGQSSSPQIHPSKNGPYMV